MVDKKDPEIRALIRNAVEIYRRKLKETDTPSFGFDLIEKAFENYQKDFESIIIQECEKLNDVPESLLEKFSEIYSLGLKKLVPKYPSEFFETFFATFFAGYFCGVARSSKEDVFQYLSALILSLGFLSFLILKDSEKDLNFFFPGSGETYKV